jgi:hypothetical protein
MCDDDGSLELGRRFENSRVRKRFLTQMVPLRNLLREYGYESSIVACAWLYIKRPGNAYGAVVALQEGELRFGDRDAIFRVCCLDRSVKYHVNTNQIRGVLQTLVRWGLLGANEIPEETVKQTIEKGRIRCGHCGQAQISALNHRFKQCKLCKDTEKSEDAPAFNGFYCSKRCQVAHWQDHKKRFHCGC